MSKRPKRDIGGTLMLGEIALRWSIRSEPQWNTTAGDIGLRLSVETEGKAHRELILEYPFQKRQKSASRFPERPRVDPDALMRDIHRAIALGWKPKSRGRPFIVAIEEDDLENGK